MGSSSNPFHGSVISSTAIRSAAQADDMENCDSTIRWRWQRNDQSRVFVLELLKRTCVATTVALIVALIARDRAVLPVIPVRSTLQKPTFRTMSGKCAV